MYTKKELNNGLRLIYEPLKHLPSVTIGVWIKAGSRYEKSNLNGISHFLEHMFFKGTKKRSAKQIADEIDLIGGQINAFTSKEYTCIYVKVLSEDLDIALDILSDMFYDSNFDENEIKKERGVIIEEINMYEDSPEEIVHDLIFKAAYGKHMLSEPVLGTKETLQDMDHNSLKNYYDSMYINENVALTVLGNFNEESIVEKINEYFSKEHSGNLFSEECNPKFHSNSIVRFKDTEQFHMCLSYEGLSFGDPNTYSLMVINNLLGGSISSMLFQRIREELGLVYSVYTYPVYNEGTGLFNLYAGFQQENFDKLINEIGIIFNNFFNKGPSEETILRAKRQLKGNYMMGLESTSSRMNLLGKSELFHSELKTLEYIHKKIDAISPESINMVINKLKNTKTPAISLIGNIKNEDEYISKIRNNMK